MTGKWIIATVLSLFITLVIIAVIASWIDVNDYKYTDEPAYNDEESIFEDMPDYEDTRSISHCGYGATGMVVNNSGNPIADVEVSANTSFHVKKDITNNNGEFNVQFMWACDQPAAFFLSFKKSGYVPQALIYDQTVLDTEVILEEMTSN